MVIVVAETVGPLRAGGTQDAPKQSKPSAAQTEMEQAAEPPLQTNLQIRLRQQQHFLSV